MYTEGSTSTGPGRTSQTGRSMTCRLIKKARILCWVLVTWGRVEGEQGKESKVNSNSNSNSNTNTNRNSNSHSNQSSHSNSNGWVLVRWERGGGDYDKQSTRKTTKKEGRRAGVSRTLLLQAHACARQSCAAGRSSRVALRHSSALPAA